MESQQAPASRTPFRLPVSLRARLIAANVAIIVVSIAALGYYVYDRGREDTAFLTTELDYNVRQRAVETMSATGASQAQALSTLFANLRQQLTSVGQSAGDLLSHETEFQTSSYWDASTSLARMPSGSWDNPASEPASVFLPAKAALTPELASELNTLRQLDFIAPNLLRQNPDIVAIYFGGPSGETVYYPDVNLASLVPTDFDVTQRPWYVAAAPAQNPKKAAVWSTPYMDAAKHGLVITVSIPVYDAAGTFRGVTAMDVQLNRVSYLVSSIHMGMTGYAFLVDGGGRLIAMSDAGYKDLGFTTETLPLGEVLDRTMLPDLPEGFFMALGRMTNGQSGLDTAIVQGKDRYIVFHPVNEVGYDLGMIVPVEEMLTNAASARARVAMSATDTRQITLVLVLAILMLSVVATLAVINSLIGPLGELTETAGEIAAGNLEAQATVRGRDEIATLAGTLNDMTGRLRELIQSLERRVKDRTAALEQASINANRRAAQFEAITQVTRAISSIRNLDELMPLVAAVISQYFGFYHVGIFLNDENKDRTWLIAANSEGGKRMLGRQHNLRIGEQGMVGYVAARGESRVARSVGEDAVFFNNPDLPETRSEAALPLRRGNEIAGVLDVQSTREDAFSDEDLAILSVLADQVGMAMETARLFETTRRSLMESETLYRQYVQEAWSRLPQEGQLTGFRYTPRGAVPVPAGAQMPAAPRGNGAHPPLVVPIKLRGEVIGNLVVQNSKTPEWTQEQLELVQAVADRVALSAENARLFDETSRRAERERLVTEITSRIRSTNDPDEMIRTAVEELRSALGATEIEIIPQVVPPSGGGQADSGTMKPRGNGAKR